MIDNIKKIEVIHSASEISSLENRIWKRHTHVFIFRTVGSVIYSFEDKEIRQNEGDVIFIPKGVRYRIKQLTDSPSGYTSVSFTGEVEAGKPTVYSYRDFTESEFILKKFPVVFNQGEKTERLKCMAVFYYFLAYLSAVENSLYSETKKFGLISPALEYLNEYIFDCKLNIQSLYELCSISDTYFRKIFIAKYKMTPQKYITTKRLSKAKSIIDSGELQSVSEIAGAVGYEDPLYFSKAFKKKYGMSPKEMMQTGVF